MKRNRECVEVARACRLDDDLEELCDIEAGKYDIFYASAKSAINQRLLESLKKDRHGVHPWVVACGIYLSLTVDAY